MLFVNEKCWILLISGICLTRAFNVYVVPDQEDDDEDTEFPTEEIPTSTEDLSDFKGVTMDSGEYTTYIFQYENEQYMGMGGNNPNERCFDEYTRCLTTLISGITPVCAFHSQASAVQNIRTFRTSCDMYMDNCFKGHRHWRVLDYGKCRIITNDNDVCSAEHKTLYWTNGCYWYYKYFTVDKTK